MHWKGSFENMHKIPNKANLRDLIAATGLVILLKLDSNRRFFSPCEILLNLGQNLQYFVPRDLEIWRMTLKNIRQRFYIVSCFVYHFIAISEFKVELQSGNAQFGSKSSIFLVVWSWNLSDDIKKTIVPLS